MPPRSSPESPPAAGPAGLRVAGKFFRRGAEKVFLHGVSYGPFRPNGQGEPFPDEARLKADLAQIRALGFNLVRLYELPTDLMLETAKEAGLSLLVGIPWTDHVDFLHSHGQRLAIEQQVVQAVRRLKEHPAVAGFLVGNEVEKTLVRWLGPVRVQHFLERLITLGREEAPEHLFSYATYPSTEYLVPRNADFVAVNLYLEQRATFTAYLQRLQNIAANKPLLITEFGIDVAKHGEAAQAEVVRWEYECLRQGGVAGHVWFSFTDEWHRGGKDITGWQFGLVTAERQPRPACEALKTLPVAAVGAAKPRISVVVCTRNGSATLTGCLASLAQLRYPNHEVVLIDDGSTHDIAAIALGFPQVRYQRQEHAGLSVARNLGASLATGEIIAYTDDDCLVDEDWLTYLAQAFDDPAWVAAGGPNIPPPPRNPVEAVVAAAPGSPAHVLLNDSEAEHLPGCNIAVRKEALQGIGGFQPVFTTAGDDVDICWRLRTAGGKLRFVPGAMVWHHRRFSVRAYLRQQHGYGKAEALLMKEHPQRFGPLGGARWRGAIYGDWPLAGSPREGTIFHGPLGHGLFQGIYMQGGHCLLDWLSGVLWVALALLSLAFGQTGLALGIATLSLVMAAYRMWHLPEFPFVLRRRDRLLLWLLCWLQPLVREWARLAGMVRLDARPNWKPALREVFVPERPRKWTIPLGEICFWSEGGLDRDRWLEAFQKLLQEENLAFRPDDGWRWFDVEVNPEALVSPAVISVTEHHGDGRSLTRVRLLLRLRLLLLICSLGAAVLLLLAFLIQPRFVLLTLTGSVILLTLSAFLQRAAMRGWVVKAARGIGLEPVKS